MAINKAPNEIDFIDLEHRTLKFWEDIDAFNTQRRICTKANHPGLSLTDPSQPIIPWEFITAGDGPTKTSLTASGP